MGQGQSASQPHPSSSSDRLPSHPPYQVDGGRFHPLTAIYSSAPQDYNHPVVHTLINARKLAPFYRGIEDVADPSDSAEIDRALDAVADKSRQHDSPPDRARERLFYQTGDKLAECPICFLNYPPFINYSRCCDHPICTECFVFIKRAEPTPNRLSSEPVACPFCVEPEFGVVYTPPPPNLRHGGIPPSSPVYKTLLPLPSILNLSSPGENPAPPEEPSSNTSSADPANRPRQKSHSANSPGVVSIDTIRPDWQDKLNNVKASVARRSNRRIVFRQVGDRVVPIGVTSNRDASPVSDPSSESNTPARRSRRSRPPEWGLHGADLEELMVLEAMRLSQLEEDERQRRDAQAAESSANDAAQASSAQPPQAPPARSSEAEPHSNSEHGKPKRKLTGAVREFLQHHHPLSHGGSPTPPTAQANISAHSIPLPLSGSSSITGSPLPSSTFPDPPQHPPSPNNRSSSRSDSLISRQSDNADSSPIPTGVSSSTLPGTSSPFVTKTSDVPEPKSDMTLDEAESPSKQEREQEEHEQSGTARNSQEDLSKGKFKEADDPASSSNARKPSVEQSADSGNQSDLRAPFRSKTQDSTVSSVAPSMMRQDSVTSSALVNYIPISSDEALNRSLSGQGSAAPSTGADENQGLLANSYESSSMVATPSNLERSSLISSTDDLDDTTRNGNIPVFQDGCGSSTNNNKEHIPVPDELSELDDRGDANSASTSVNPNETAQPESKP